MQDEIKVCGPLKEKLTRRYTRQVLEGLKYLHDQNIIHRDIKGTSCILGGLNKVSHCRSKLIIAMHHLRFSTGYSIISAVVDFFIFLPPNLHGSPVNRYQILTQFRCWPHLSPPKKWRQENIKIRVKFWTTSELDRICLWNKIRCRRTDNGLTNCNLSCACELNLVNFSTQTEKYRTIVLDRATHANTLCGFVWLRISAEWNKIPSNGTAFVTWFRGVSGISEILSYSMTS